MKNANFLAIQAEFVAEILSEFRSKREEYKEKINLEIFQKNKSEKTSNNEIFESFFSVRQDFFHDFKKLQEKIESIFYVHYEERKKLKDQIYNLNFLTLENLYKKIKETNFHFFEQKRMNSEA